MAVLPYIYGKVQSSISQFPRLHLQIIEEAVTFAIEASPKSQLISTLSASSYTLDLQVSLGSIEINDDVYSSQYRRDGDSDKNITNKSL